MTRPRMGAVEPREFSAWWVACKPASRPSRARACPTTASSVINPSLALGHRDREVEGRPQAEFAFEPDPSTHHFDQALGDVQPESRAGSLARLLVLRAEELFKDLLLVFQADADAVIPHPDMHHFGRAARIPLVGGPFRPDRDAAVLRRVLVGVADKVGQDLAQPGGVGPDLG